MKTGYQTTWVPVASADMEALEAQHRRVFSGNVLSIIKGYAKVAVKNGETKAVGAITTDAVKPEWAFADAAPQLSPKNRVTR